MSENGTRKPRTPFSGKEEGHMNEGERLEKRTPKVISGGAIALPVVEVPQAPTRTPKKLAAATPKSDAAAPSVRSGPKAVGEVRKRIPINLRELSAKHPGVKQEILEESIRHIHAVVLEDTSESLFALWGNQSQSDFNELMTEGIEVLEAEPIAAAERHLARLQTILREIADEFIPDDTLMGKVLGGRKDPRAAWTKHRQEIGQLSDALRRGLQPLLNTKGKLEASTNELTSLADLIRAQVIAGEFLRDYMRKEMGGTKELAAETLSARTGSLTMTLAQMVQNELVRAASQKTLVALVTSIQDGILVSLPGWVEACLLYAKESTPTQTMRDELERALGAILNLFPKPRNQHKD